MLIEKVPLEKAVFIAMYTSSGTFL